MMIFIHRYELMAGIKAKKASSILFVVASLVFLLFTVIILSSPESRARSGLLFVVDQGAVNRIIERRNTSKLPLPVKRILYNRPVYFVTQFTKNYISYFSPKFLFFKGGTQYQFSVPGRGLIYPVNMPFFYIGLAFVLTRVLLHKNYRMLFAWLILSPIPASLTNESFAVLRSTAMLPMPEILTALGFYWVISKLNKKYISIFFASYFALLLFFAEGYLTDYFTSYRTNYSWSWQYGYKEAVLYANSRYDLYDKIIMTKKYGEPHEYFLFFGNYDPQKYLDDPQKIAYAKSSWWWVDRFDKYWFINDWQVKLNKPEVSSIQQTFVAESGHMIDCREDKCLLITSPGNYPPGWNKLETISFLDGKAAFEIYDNK